MQSLPDCGECRNVYTSIEKKNKLGFWQTLGFVIIFLSFQVKKIKYMHNHQNFFWKVILETNANIMWARGTALWMPHQADRLKKLQLSWHRVVLTSHVYYSIYFLTAVAPKWVPFSDATFLI